MKASETFTLYGRGAAPIKTGAWGEVWAEAQRVAAEGKGRSFYVRQGVTSDGSEWLREGVAGGRLVRSFEAGAWLAL